ncbi:MAG: FtsX-like permease family protein [Bacilli bacterium]|nr:FtsX-like permease family protein [Bacilli bacterium]MDD4809336.1 FtsX-like permease family protein [Bacilli bacterium]
MKILNNLTIKHLKMNKRRTIVTIIGILLSTALMVGIGLLFSTVRDNSIESIKKYSGDYHAKISEFKYSNIDKLDNSIIDSYFYETSLGFSYFEKSTNEYKPYLHVLGVNTDYFNELTLVEGRFPNNDSEVVISSHIATNGGVNYQIGDTLNLELGDRISDGKALSNDYGYTNSESEYIDIKNKKEYLIVGIIKRSVFEDYSAPGYNLFTIINETDLVNIYLRYHKPTKTFKLTEQIGEQFNLEKIQEQGEIHYPQVDYNSSLLATYGVSKYNNVLSSVAAIMVIILTLISIGCIIVIYNSFAISVMERKKHFGLLSSIGATKKQIQKTVFFEAFIVGIIGITLGILSAFIGIGILLQVVNLLLDAMFDFPLKLAVYPIFIIIPLIFMILVVLLSAYLPAKRASKITPIDAIRQNDDIKINKKKIKTNKLFNKTFGIEGEIALKNMKRNKKKYRITILSLVTSIVLFVSFSSIVNYGLTGSNDYFAGVDYDIYINVYKNNEEIETKINTILKLDEIKKSSIMRVAQLPIALWSEKIYNNKYLKVLKDQLITLENYQEKEHQKFKFLNFVSIDEENYQNYLKELGLKENKPIFVNKSHYVSYENRGRKSYNLSIIDDVSKLEVKLCRLKEFRDKIELPIEEFNQYVEGKCNYSLDNLYFTDKAPYGTNDLIQNSGGIIIVDRQTYDNLMNEFSLFSSTFGVNSIDNYTIVIEADQYQEIDKIGEELKKFDDVYYNNVKEQLKMQRNIILVIKILLYGFISLVTLIGVTSVFNTISTSLALRKKEFAMLRSVGLTPKGFNKILYFESLFFGLKSLLFALPISLGITYLIHRSIDDVVSYSELIIPYKSIIISIIGVFIIVLITMFYSTRKMKGENILETIREENI